MTDIAGGILEIRSKLCGDARLFGAFRQGDVLSFRLTFPRSDGVRDPELIVTRDGGEANRILFIFEKLSGDREVYRAELCCDNPGLFWYDITYDTLYGKRNAVSGRQLTVYSMEYSTPDWIKGGIMYQIFVDRFARGGKTTKRSDAVMIDDWYNGEPEYPEVRGGHLENNTFFGGTLYGVSEKLEYLASLGVNCIYLCPIFEAYSNHKYDIGDYSKIDEMFGGEDAFDKLIIKAESFGIKVILDGVFNHTGADSVYFNKFGRYGSGGAYNDPESEYYSWYNFRSFPNDYECWWNIPILPRVNGNDPSFSEYILGENGIVKKYLRLGAAGWRLDVADELSDIFLDGLRKSVKSENKDAVIYGEVWEDASNKISYGKRRRYLQGSQLDGVMNYVFRNAIISFVTGSDASDFARVTEALYYNYPKCASDVAMNILGTHDTVRILNALSAPYPDGATNRQLSESRLSDDQRSKGKKLLKTAWLICATLPGVPCIYYGDEAGMEGWGDPFCRRPYPWGREDKDLIEYYRKIGSFRRSRSIYREGVFRILTAEKRVLIYSRGEEKDALYTAVNLGDQAYPLPFAASDALSGETISELAPYSAYILNRSE